jgi:hypothetical protein
MEIKQRVAWTMEIVWCYAYCKKYFTGTEKKTYQVWIYIAVIKIQFGITQEKQISAGKL